MVKKILRILCTISGIYVLLDIGFIIYARVTHNDKLIEDALDGMKHIFNYRN